MHNLFRTAFLLALAAVFVCGSPVRPAMADETAGADPAKVLHVSPEGDDAAPGTRERPLATVRQALSRLPSTGGGEITLLGGIYTEEVVLPSAKGAELLTLRAAPGQKVVFDGSEEIVEAQEWNSRPGLYRVALKEGDAENLNLWEPSGRVRYQRQIDPAGVEAWPGSFCLLDDSHLLVHTVDGKEPKARGLRRSRVAVAIRVQRSHVAIRGIHFQNYLGDRGAGAVIIHNLRKDVEIADCEMTNMVKGVGIEMRAERVRISNCNIRDVGTGILNLGFDVDIRDCVIQAARGAFAIEHEIGLYSRNAIRSYHPAQGGHVTGCVTAGFWAGLYIKTGQAVSLGKDTARPFVIEHNVFLDGIKRGEATQALNRYAFNIVSGGKNAFNSLKTVGAAVESNYFINDDREPLGFDGGNQAGPDPFADLEKGDLAIRSGLALDNGGAKEGNAAERVHWTPEIAAFLKGPSARQGEPRFVAEPEAAASALGAVVTARLSFGGKGLLRYRAVGEKQWRETGGIDSTLSTPDAINKITLAPDEGEASSSEFGLTFPLLDGVLKSGAGYEYQVEAAGPGGKTIRSGINRFYTRGAPKELHVRAGAASAEADGSVERPFPQLQAALDRALPGDTILLQKGVYTSPAILSHGGAARQPITIRGAGEGATILDGGRAAPVLLELRRAKNVVVEEMQFRWFRKTGIAVRDGENIIIQRCRFLNRDYAGRESPDGYGILLENTVGSVVTHCVFTRTVYGVLAMNSPRLKLRNNTGFKNLYASATLIHSSRDSEVTGNSFGFSGIASLIIREPDAEAFGSLVCDFNNYGALLGRHPVNTEQIRPENDFQPAQRYGKLGTSKRIIDMVKTEEEDRLRFYQMKTWREFSGKDAHSIYADPQYADPLRGDFRLIEGTPNLLEGNDHAKRLIGAAPLIETPPPISSLK